MLWYSHLFQNFPHFVVIHTVNTDSHRGLPRGSVGKQSACNVGDMDSVPELRRFPGEGKGYTPVFWPGEFHGLYSSWGHKESDTTEQLSLSF